MFRARAAFICSGVIWLGIVPPNGKRDAFITPAGVDVEVAAEPGDLFTTDVAVDNPVLSVDSCVLPLGGTTEESSKEVYTLRLRVLRTWKGRIQRFSVSHATALQSRTYEDTSDFEIRGRRATMSGYFADRFSELRLRKQTLPSGRR